FSLNSRFCLNRHFNGEEKMLNTKTIVLALGTLAILAMLRGAAEPVAAAGPPGGLQVDVVNTPLPVTGSVTLAPGTAVDATVVNPANMPALTSSIDERGRVAYQSTIRQTCDPTTHFCTFTFPQVPSGHRLVINHISGDVSYQSNATHTIAFLNTKTGPQGIQ